MKFDVCVVGGGMVGTSIALGLAQLGYRIALVERHMPAPFVAAAPPDLRVSAINMASVSLLKALAAWQHIEAMRVHPYANLEVWEDVACKTRFSASDIDAPLLGYFIENRVLQLGLHKALQAFDNVHWFTGVDVKHLSTRGTAVQLSNDTWLDAELIIGADGSRSRVRSLADIGTTGWHYEQQALAIKVHTSQEQNTTWQQFFTTGPRAFLPLADGYACLIWYDHPDTIATLKRCDWAALTQQVEEHFPDCLGTFEILDVASFPLTRMHANQYVKGRVALLGDAAHSINPLAGQGLNLGFKDVTALLKQAEYADKDGQSLWKGDYLHKFEQQRRLPNLLMMSTMDAIYTVFSNQLSAVKVIRNAGLGMAQQAGPLKHQVMKYAMGL